MSRRYPVLPSVFNTVGTPQASVEFVYDPLQPLIENEIISLDEVDFFDNVPVQTGRAKSIRVFNLDFRFILHHIVMCNHSLAN